jgi:hypothetical protein
MHMAPKDLEDPRSKHPHSAKNENIMTKGSFGSAPYKGDGTNASEVSSSAAWLDNPPNAGGFAKQDAGTENSHSLIDDQNQNQRIMTVVSEENEKKFVA